MQRAIGGVSIVIEACPCQQSELVALAAARRRNGKWCGAAAVQQEQCVSRQVCAGRWPYVKNRLEALWMLSGGEGCCRCAVGVRMAEAISGRWRQCGIIGQVVERDAKNVGQGIVLQGMLQAQDRIGHWSRCVWANRLR